MKTFLSLFACAFLFAAVIDTHAADASEAPLTVEAEKVVENTWKELTPMYSTFDCDNFDCPTSGVTTVQQCFEVPDCPNVTDAELRAAVNRVVNKFCESFKRCCVANGCDEGDCRLVSFTHFCASKIRLCVTVRIEYKCQ